MRSTLNAITTALAAAIAEGLAFDAVFAVTDAGAIGAFRALGEAGRVMPDDVQVVGFDNLALAPYLVPSLTTIEPDNDAMVDAVCELVLTSLGLDAPAATGDRGRVRMPTARIVRRESTRGPTRA
ncbi:substrate-binding domain-containing protein [Tessaracoccus flavus]|uniref:substrate-binding domain-containing protein n=1 Tax=Tessaracoccus flavus TaxID=1610493 RepID=UPI001D035EA8|nr:substrate-binding domain-containing protein [Tessaracoccus flavus]